MEWPLDGDVEETILTLAAKAASLRDCASLCGVCRRWRSLLRGGSRTVRASAYAEKPWLFAYAERPGALHMFDPLKWQWQTAMNAGNNDQVPVPIRLSDGGDGALYFRWDEALLLRLNCLSSISTFRWPEAPPVPGQPQHRPLLFFSRGLGKVAVATRAYLAVLDLRKAQWSTPGLPAVLGRPSAGAVRGSLLYLFSAGYSNAACLDMATGKWLFTFRLQSAGGGMAFIDGGRHGFLIPGLAEPIPGHENPFQKQDYLTLRVWKILVDEPRFTKEYRAGRTPTADCIELCRMPPDLSRNFFDCENTVQCKGMNDLIYFCAPNSAAAACQILDKGNAVWCMLPSVPNSAKEYGCWTVDVDEIDNSEPDSMVFFQRLYPESASVFSQHSHDMGDGVRLHVQEPDPPAATFETVAD